MSFRCAIKAVSLGAVVFGLFAGCGGSAYDSSHAKWSFISTAIIEPSCATASCHSDVAQKAGVNLYNKDVGYNALVKRLFVVPSNPQASELMFLLRAQGTRRMPPDFPLPEEDIQLIGQWITNGAMNN
ncbi:MAG: hypothetical protein QOI66_3652 [Myxococcales bacterium]|jgi:hypothetical protein|nr:hypothetical protein [Myxococcales bacterium]